jgi:hypothetical protein
MMEVAMNTLEVIKTDTVNAPSEPVSDFYAEVDTLRKIEPVDEALDSIIASAFRGSQKAKIGAYDGFEGA